jgi:hypothetical protein
MISKILETPVDHLVKFVKDHPNSSVTSIRENLKVPGEILERWLVVLEEYKIIDVEYKGFEGFVTFVGKKESKDEVDIDNLKEIFVNSAKKTGMPYDKIREAWPIFLSKYESEIHELFIKKAKKLGFDQSKVTVAWNKYWKGLEVL